MVMMQSRLSGNGIASTSAPLQQWAGLHASMPMRSHHQMHNAKYSVSFKGRDKVKRTRCSVMAPVREGKEVEDVNALEGTSSLRSSLRILVAGGGIGGLVFAVAARNRGMNVQVFERDLTAIRGEGQYRGPIQVQSNALAALEAVDEQVAEEVMKEGCITGDRINGLCDGLTGEWYVKFDTFTPAVEGGLPVTRVISRMRLQEILVNAVGPGVIRNGATVQNFSDDGQKVTVTLDNGEEVVGDILIGADGIRSRVRELLLGPTLPTYADYTCYTGICDFTPADIDTVGYRVFLGNRQYFVSSDVGQGKMQWYAFYNEPAGGTDAPNGRKERLRELFGAWCDGVTELIEATPEEDVLRRDIYDRIPIFQWTKGRVALLGDSAHAMQPNMGQGGCMAIEDGFQLAVDLDKALSAAEEKRQTLDLESVLHQYERERVLRVGAIHGMARMAAIMASTYKAYLGEGLGPLSGLTKLRIPHWGKMAGQVVMNIAMPIMLKWVLAGNQFALEGRAPSCRLEDKASDELMTWMVDNDALERASDAEWYLLPAGERMPATGAVTESGRQLLAIGSSLHQLTVVGSAPRSQPDSLVALVNAPGVEPEHVRIQCTEEHAFHITDISESGSWITRNDGSRLKLTKDVQTRLHPGDTIELGSSQAAKFRIKLRKETAPA